MDPWHYDTAEDLDRTLVQRLRGFPRQPDMLVYGARAVAAVTIRAWLRVYHRLTITGRENLPSEGAFVLLANPGNVLLLFPEGTRTVTGELGEFKAGLGLLLAGTPHPVVPCHLEGAYRAWPKGSRLPRPRRVRLAIGQPRDYSHLKRGKQSAIEITQDLREAILRLRCSSFV